MVTAFSDRFTCFWVWIGSSLVLPKAAFAMIILNATYPFRWLATTAPLVSGLGLLPMTVTQRVTFGRLWLGADVVSIEGIASCSFWLLGFANKAMETIVEGSPKSP
ncbi:unnamed protein product [Prunus brigantina]